MAVEFGDRDHVEEADVTDDCICAGNDLLVKAGRVGLEIVPPVQGRGPRARRVVSPRDLSLRKTNLATPARAPVRVHFGLHQGEIGPNAAPALHRAPTRSHPASRCCPSLRPMLHDAPGIGLELSRLGWSALELSCVSIALVLDHRELAPTGMGVARFYTSWSAAPGSRARG